MRAELSCHTSKGVKNQCRQSENSGRGSTRGNMGSPEIRRRSGGHRLIAVGLPSGEGGGSKCKKVSWLGEMGDAKGNREGAISSRKGS